MTQHASKRQLKAENFVRTWQKSNSVQEVAAALGIQTQNAYVRARYYRKNGVVLKKLDGEFDSRKIDLDKLKKIAETCRNHS